MDFSIEHKILYQLLDEVTSILKQHNIPYYLIGGSAIGAVRDHQIIPWDDDIDLGLYRTDFQKAIELITKANLQKTTVISPSQNNDYDLTMAKVVRETPGQRLVDQGTGIVGAYIDLFPLDYTSKNKFLRQIHQFQFRLGRTLVVSKKEPSKIGKKWGKLGTSILRRYASKKSYQEIYQKRDAYIKTSKLFRNSGVYFNFGSPYHNDREIYFKPEISKAVYKAFGPAKQPVPQGYDKILTRTYGKYMQPPKDKTQRHLKVAENNDNKKTP